MASLQEQIKHIKKGLKIVREDYNVTQTTVARDNNICPSTISKAENPETKGLSLKLLLKLIQYYGVTFKTIQLTGLNYYLDEDE